MQGFQSPERIPDSERWFAMRATYRRCLDAKTLLEKHGLSVFIPMRYQEHKDARTGRKVRQLVPVVSNLLFVYAPQERLQAVKQQVEFLQYMVDTRSRQKIVIPDAQMRRFIAVAGTYDDNLLWMKPEEVNWTKGTRVRVTGGPLVGYEGVFVKVKGARDRRLVIHLEGVVAVAMATIPPDLLVPVDAC